MDYTHKSNKCKVQGAYIKETDGKKNLTVTLSGHERAQSALMATLASNKAGHYVERNAETNMIEVTMPLASENTHEDAVNTLLALHYQTDCKLNLVHVAASFDKMGDGETARYMPNITLKAVKKKKDPNNIAGELTLGAIELLHGKQKNYAVDPLNMDDSVRLICLDTSFATDTEALANAEAVAKDIEKEFGIFTPINADLRLTELRQSSIDHSDQELGLATARLEGKADNLKYALRTLRRRHQNRIAELASGDGYIDIGTASKDEIDSTGLLAAVHMATGCHLPVDITPFVGRSKKFPYPYEAGVETRVTGDETGLQKPTLRHAAARYAGSFIADETSVPEEIDPASPSRIVVHPGHNREEEAKESAERIADMLSERLKGNFSKGHNHRG